MNILYALESIRTPFLDQFFSLVTHFGSETLFLAIAIIVFWFCGWGGSGNCGNCCDNGCGGCNSCC